MLFWPSASFFPSSNTACAPVLCCYRALHRVNGGLSQGLLIETEKHNTAKYIVYKSHKHLLATLVAFISPSGWEMMSIRSEGRLSERDLEHWSELVIDEGLVRQAQQWTQIPQGQRPTIKWLRSRKNKLWQENCMLCSEEKNYTFINWKVHKYHRHHLNPQKQHDTLLIKPSHLPTFLAASLVCLPL